MILDKIVSDNLPDLEARKQSVPLPELVELIQKQPPPLDFTAAIKGKNIKLIAEVKKASPSKGIIRADFDPVAIARTYAAAGAAAISVLTEEKYFQGKLQYITEIQKALEHRVPLLRKDFLHDPYQVYESRAYGADALLLIVAILSPAKLREMLELSHQLGMYCLVEVHTEAELKLALNSGARIIGINNRDLKTFKVDLANTDKLKPLIPADRIAVSESGIHTHDDVLHLGKLGIDAVLIGEALMAAKDIGAKVRELL